jgi:hypothetical protein
MRTELTQIDPILITEQVERILKSKVFAAATRSQAFLRMGCREVVGELAAQRVRHCSRCV